MSTDMTLLRFDLPERRRFIDDNFEDIETLGHLLKVKTTIM
jgi:hypothetical protein